ncbi:MAG: hypothetical protein WAS27_04695 [Candidatus Saccharimonadales bacterium]
MIELLYSIAGSVAIIAGSTQVRALIKTGRSEELSITTWVLWCGTQAISLLYMITIHQPLLILFNALWVTLYGLMVGLILYYRKYPRTEDIEPRQQLAEEYGERV